MKFKRVYRRPRRLSYKSKRLLLQKKKLRNIVRLIKSYSLPTKIKLLGMKEKKNLVLRCVQTFTPEKGKNDTNYYYQILLDPTLSSDINKVKTQATLLNTNYKKFIYDYMKISNIVIVIRPFYTQGPTAPYPDAPATNSTNVPISSPIYGYYTLKMPPALSGDADGTKKANAQSFSIRPNPDYIKSEGMEKSLFSFPYNTPVTLALRSIYYRSNSNPFFVIPNPYVDLQCAYTFTNGNELYEPFRSIHKKVDKNIEEKSEEKIEKYESDSESKEDDDKSQCENTFGANVDGTTIEVDGLNETNYFGNYGRVVLVSKVPYSFTAEIIYKATFLR